MFTIKLHPAISHLTLEQLEQLMEEYYTNEKPVKEILNKYRINGRPSQLVSFFPPITLQETCEYCDIPLIKKRDSRTGYSSSHPFCPECDHIVDTFYCGCENCKKKHAEEKEQKNKEEQIKMEEKRLAILQTYDPSLHNKVEEQTLTLIQLLSLGALLRLGLSEDGQVINPPIGYLEKLTPIPDFNTELILELAKSHIIIPDVNSRVDAFEDGENFPHAYYIHQVSYYLNVAPIDGNKPLMIQRLLNPDPNLYKEETDLCFSFWKKVALAEVLEYLRYSIEKVGFELNPGEKTLGILNNLLETYSVSQLYSIIYRSIANSAKFYQESNITKKHAGNLVVNHIHRFGERAKAEGWEIKGFRRNYDLPQTAISEIFFNRILNIGSLGFEIAPTREIW